MLELYYIKGGMPFPPFFRGNMKKLITLVTLICFISFISPPKSYSYVSAVAAGVLAGAGSLLYMAGAFKYYNVSAPISTYFNNTGDTYRQIYATWQGVNDYGAAQAYNKLIAARISFEDLMESIVNPYITSGQPSPYPNLYNYLTYPPNTPTVNENMSIGGIYIGECGTFRVVSKQVNYSPNSYVAVGTTQCNSSGTVIFHTADPINGGVLYNTYFGTDPVVVPRLPKTSPVVLNDIDSTSQNSSFQSQYSDELDRLFANVIPSKPANLADTGTREDVHTAPTFVPPIGGTMGAATPSITTAPSAAAAASATTAANTKSSLSTSATEAVNNYQAANPASTIENDPVLAALVNTAAAAAAAATAATDLATKAQAESDVPMPAVTIDSLKLIDFSPFLSLQGVLATKFPFTLLSTISGFLSIFSGSAVAPVFSITVPFITTPLSINLSLFDPIAILCRWSISILASIGTIYLLVRRYSS